MKKTARILLSLQRTTVRTLSSTDLAAADGGTLAASQVCPPPTIVTRTTLGPSAVDGCQSALQCTGSGGPSIIVNPPGRSL